MCTLFFTNGDTKIDERSKRQQGFIERKVEGLKEVNKEVKTNDRLFFECTFANHKKVKLTSFGCKKL